MFLHHCVSVRERRNNFIMEYERIHKAQISTGLISPSKLRMKLVGSLSQMKKDGSKSNSSRTSPVRIDDSEFVNNSLLADENGEEDSSLEVSQITCESSMQSSSQSDANSMQQMELLSKEIADTNCFKGQPVLKSDSGNSSSVHPVRTCEDENLDYDSTSSFEFHKGERKMHHSLSRSFSRPLSSKWNDAEKWIMNKQNWQPNILKKSNFQNQVNQQNKLSVKKVDFCLNGLGKSGVSSLGSAQVSSQGIGVNTLIDMCPETKDLKEVNDMGFPCTKSVTEEKIGVPPAIRSVSMRDMGTEMTPIPSQEPSRSVTPLSSTTPLRSPTSSLPSTPRRGDPTPTPTDTTQQLTGNGKRGLSDQEMKLKTRREIVALGMQLGKMNIAEWASKDVKEKGMLGHETDIDEIENAKRAAAWEEAEKSKHAARFKREEIRIQAWESRQNAKLETEMRKIEAQIEQMRAQAQAKMVKKIALARQKSEENRALAEACKIKQAERTAAQAEYMRETGRIPSSPFICCGWS